jgi:PAS domain-containing protein
MIDAPPRTHGAGGEPFPGETLIEELERIEEPAYLVVPGGRIAAANRAAQRLAGIPLVGMTVRELVERYGASRADGHRLTCSDLPHTRSLRCEVVNHGERFDMTLPDGSTYHALVTSTPVIVDGEVMASLSVHHDFDRLVQRLAGEDGQASSSW